MATLRCNTCGGEFADVLPDGTLYFHACPPVYDERLKRFAPRADRRDENRARPLTRGQPAPMKREGTGVTVLEGTPGVPLPIEALDGP